MEAKCKCAEATPTYPVYRLNPHLRDCEHYKPENDLGAGGIKTLSTILGVSVTELNDMRFQAVAEMAERHVRAVNSLCLKLELLCRDNPDNPLSGTIRAMLRHQTRLFPPLENAK